MGKTDADYLPLRIRFSIGGVTVAAMSACAIAGIIIGLSASIADLPYLLFEPAAWSERLGRLGSWVVGFLANFLLPIPAILFGFLGAFACLAPCLAIAHLKPTKRNFVIAGVVSGLLHAAIGLSSQWALAGLRPPSEGDTQLLSFVVLFSGLMAYALRPITIWAAAIAAPIVGAVVGIIYWKIITFGAR